MQDIYVIFFVAFVFYLLGPVLGATMDRRRWLKFRTRLLDASLQPVVDYSDISGQNAVSTGSYRFFGTLEAIQGENRIWLTNGSFSIGCDLTDIMVYMMPKDLADDFENNFPDNQPVSVKWSRISSIPEGTQVFVFGTLFVKNGRGVFKSRPRNPLLVVIYDGDKRELLKRAVFSGRQRNEYWNDYTWISLVTGISILLVLSFLKFQGSYSRSAMVLAIALSILPVSLFLPPGVLLFFLYRALWKRTRILRSQRDIFLLPLRYFKDQDLSSDKQEFFSVLPDKAEYILLKTGESGGRSYYPVLGGSKTRMSRFFPKYQKESGESFLFGEFVRNADGAYVTNPSDPMAELILIPGNPETIARKCSRRALIYTVLSFLIMGVEIAGNFAFILYILWNTIR
jgi:hypothetical protein